MPYNKDNNHIVKLIIRNDLYGVLKKEADSIGIPLTVYIKLIISDRPIRK